ncbi:MAG: hypothetical protein J6Q84_07280 [Kiritimatiellae bacterium]|nr:hypothetical protein [Kiritimatiellia bacterium]
MKWGVRRTPEQLGYKTNKEVRKLSEHYARAHRELVMYRQLKAQKDRGNATIPDEALSFLATRASTGLRWCTKYAKTLSKKYTVDIEPEYEADGRQYITTTLKDKMGNVYVHEIYSKVRAHGDYLYAEPDNP